MKTLLAAATFAALAALAPTAPAQPAPPELLQLPAVEASAPAQAASQAPKRRCVAGCDGQSARVSWSEDGMNRFEAHRDAAGKLVRLYVHPKSGAPRYELKLAEGRATQAQTLQGFAGADVVSSQAPQPMSKQAVWEVVKF
jgi:hypothetical protein